MYRRDFGRFSSYVNKYLLFFRFTDFSRSCRYFSSIVIPINFYHVECGDGRQPRTLTDKFWIPRSKTRTFSTPVLKIFDHWGDVFICLSINTSAPSHWLKSVAWPVGPVLKFRDIPECYPVKGMKPRMMMWTAEIQIKYDRRSGNLDTNIAIPKAKRKERKITSYKSICFLTTVTAIRLLKSCLERSGTEPGPLSLIVAVWRFKLWTLKSTLLESKLVWRK